MFQRAFAFAAVLGLGFALARAEEIPRQAPEFAVLNPAGGGQQLLLSSQRGKVVVMAFMYTTCPHCQHMSAILNTLYGELGPRGFEPIGVAFNPMANMLVPDFVKQGGLKFPVGWSERDTVLTFLQLNPDLRFMVPQLVFIDRKGVIRVHVTGGDPFFGNDDEKAVRAEVEKLLGEPAASAKTAPHARPAHKTARHASL